MNPPFLRAPPFPDRHAVVSRPGNYDGALDGDILHALRKARVGGAFWLAPEPQDGAVRGVIRPRRDAEPWTSLAGAMGLVADGDDEWVAIARILGLPVEILSPGRFGSPGDDADVIDRCVVRVLSEAEYVDPFTGEPATIHAVIAQLAEWRRLIEVNRKITVACGMAWWKRTEIRRFLWAPGRQLHFASGTDWALDLARKTGGDIAVWPSRVSESLLNRAREQGTGIVRVEDGFVRSVGLGSNLVPPSSVVVDHSGIHYDPSQPSDLEQILATTEFPAELEQRAAALRQAIVAAGIGKYGAGEDSSHAPKHKDRRRVLVPAQVEDDMSVLAGGGGLHSNLELLRRVRSLEPDSEIWFRPHPDVDAGHRKGAVPDDEVLQYADSIKRGGSMAGLLGQVDAVHVLTSLTGFEALLRGLEVFCHGAPFYAGWGLTRDLGAVPERRGRKLGLDQLVAAVLILYPRYLDPVSGLPCPPETLVARIAGARAPNRLGWLAPLRRWQGRFMAKLR